MPGTHLAYANPSPEVQAAVAAVKDACATWHKTEVANLPPPPAPQHQTLTEAQVCSYIKDPDADLLVAAELTLLVVVVFAVFIWLTRLHHLPGTLFRLAFRRRNRGVA
jgi:hypothetical protein